MKKKITPLLKHQAILSVDEPDETPSGQVAERSDTYGKGMRVIQPLSDDLHLPASAPTPAPAIEVEKPTSIHANPSDAVPRPPHAASNAYPTPRDNNTFGPPQSPAKRLPLDDPADDDGPSRLAQALRVFFLATIAGGVFYYVYDTVVKQLPHSFGNCSASLFGVSCNPLWLTGFFTALILFSLASYVVYARLGKSFLLAFGAAGLCVAAFFFLEFNGALGFFDWRMMDWLLGHRWWNTIVIPAGIAGVVAAAVCVASTYLRERAVLIFRYLGMAVAVLALILMPKLTHQLAAKQTVESVKQQQNVRTKDVLKTDIPLYVPKNYSGALKLTHAHEEVSSESAMPFFSFSYKVPASTTNIPADVVVGIYKASAAHFSPPDNCGNGRPWDYVVRNDSANYYPCKLVLTTSKGRHIYADTRSNVFSLQKDQPNFFYVPMGAYVVSVSNSDITLPPQPSGLLTPEEVGQFADSLERLTGKDLAQFSNTYFTSLF